MSFRIIIDTREQEPYEFSCPTERRKLEVGDYSVDGHTDVIAVERKSLKDFISTVIHARKRFAREMEKLKEYPFSCVVVEANLDDVLRGIVDTGNVESNAVLGAALWLTTYYRVPVFWCGSRPAARVFVDGFLRMFVRARNEAKDETQASSEDSESIKG